ncbi:PREDICTED: cathepsin L1-like [Rhagoletis zephyria]|uniref:cathepsin L1-like n=1 Tax=Rhagoletis zephyria TaxID=28612 RepID=UPI0008117710|nr:PREDICTED: cathepsin L1-like [Rhagoletis zephyria]
MKFVIAVLALATLATATNEFFSEKELETHFSLFKTEFGRNYSNSEEETYRKGVFADNLEFILKHNREYQAGLKSFSVGVNNFADMTNAEFRAHFNGFRPYAGSIQSEDLNKNTDNASASVDLPDTVDWVQQGLVTPVKNQHQCGGCWAFSAVAAMEGQHARSTGQLVSLSEQNLIDCSYANRGCGGGWPFLAYQYVISNRGIDTEQSYPYTAHQGPCAFRVQNVGAIFRSYSNLPQGSENSLQGAVANVGPISVAIDASQPSFQLYKQGMYDEPACSPTKVNHAVTVVGYGLFQGVTPYWKVKNSWGVTWGDQGYIFMSRNKGNQCGIASYASYPIV